MIRKINRRSFIHFFLFTGAAFALTKIVDNGDTCVNQEWNPDLSSLSHVHQMDLNLTLPHSIQRGGVFKVDSQSSQLPEGLVLSPNGLLTRIQFQPVQIQGLKFIYEEPS